MQSVAGCLGLALAELLAGGDRLPRDGKALRQRSRARPAAGAPGAPGKAFHRPLCLSEPRAQPGRRRREASKHMEGTAFDIAMSSHDPAAFEAATREAGFLGFGFYPRSDFMHVDLGPKREWGERFAPRPTSFAVETPPARERLAESRNDQGRGVPVSRPSAPRASRLRRRCCPRRRMRSCRSCITSTALSYEKRRFPCDVGAAARQDRCRPRPQCPDGDLTSIPGIAAITAITMLIELPEVRLQEYSLAYSEVGFRTGIIDVRQMVFARQS